jgi:glycerol-3-phosphate acyltransferase PlsX
MKIALDAMGGDHAPGPVVAGAVQAVAADPELRVVLVGDQARVEPLVPADAVGRDRIEFFHASQVVGMEESPVVGLRKKPDNSISRCWQLLAHGKVGGIVSAGNTGAMVAGGLLGVRRFLKNVSRPGIATIMPTIKGPSVMIDVGANVSPKAEHLFQYGVMGAIFAKHILQRDRPTIGLMNVGSEEAKGHDLAKDTHALFNASPLKDRFVGNVEGRDLQGGGADVVVCDGFVGNVVLKTCEGVFDFLLKVLQKELLSALDAERGKAAQVLQELANRYDYSAYGGAPLLGIDGICIICHGSSGDRAIKNALGMAAQYARAGLNELIVKELEKIPAAGAQPG